MWNRSRPRRGGGQRGSAYGMRRAASASSIVPPDLLAPEGNDQGHGRGSRRGFPRSGYRGRGNFRGGRPREDGIPCMSYRFIESLVNDEELSSMEIALRLSTEQSGFSQLLRQDLKEGMTQMLLKLFGRLCKDEEFNHSLSLVLQEVLKRDFMTKSIPFLYGLTTEENPRRRNEAHVHVSNALYLLKAMLVQLPRSSAKQVSMLHCIVEQVSNRLNLRGEDNISFRLEEIQQLVQEAEESRKTSKNQDKKENSAQDFLAAMHEERPPDDFRQISIFPQQADIRPTENLFIRTNLISSAYHDHNHYLDVQFRLLREDFVRPLREGIDYYRGEGKMASKRQIAQHVKLYNRVSVEYPMPWRTGVVHCIRFDPAPFARVRWQNSKRLMFGNLVCLSHDEFQNHLLFGTVVDRKPEQLSQGYLLVEFVHSVDQKEVLNLAKLNINDEDEDNEALEGEEGDEMRHEAEEQQEFFSIPNIDLEKTYTMVESEAYFEAYRHVLLGLQGIRRIPLERYIVQCNSDIRPPRYLQVLGSTYDFSPIIQGRRVGILNTEYGWPTAEEMKLDESQLKAVKSALTSELSVIQGPPGTGKTYIGLVVMKLLLANREITGKLPILVVCYTNHALDQFLEGISDFHPNGIVRVGGRCKNENLAKYTLSMIKRNTQTKRFNRKTFYQLRDQQRDLERQMKTSVDILEASRNVIIKLSKLQTVIPHDLFDQFYQIFGEDENTALLTWLGLHHQETVNLKDNLIISETLEALAAPLLAMGFDRRTIFHAMAITRTFQVDFILNWMMTIRPTRPNQIPDKEMVYEFLHNVPLPFNVRPMTDEGFRKLEISCAYLATGSANPHDLEEWISRKSGGDENEMQSEQQNEENSNDVREEADLIMEQRMLDEDFMIYLDKNKKRQQDEERRKKQLIESISAQVFFSHDESHRGDNDSGWETTSKQKKEQKRKMKFEMKKVDAMCAREAGKVSNLLILSNDKRWKLYRRWIKDYQAKLREGVERHYAKYNQLCKSLHEFQRAEDRAVLKEAQIIGITTTGAAKYRDIIYQLPVQVVVVEEAAEVLEAHVITSMPESTQQLILIGDHQQLKPSPTVFELARKYNLDTSLFERMIKNGTPFQSLSTQHRMRPHIADLLRLNIYEHLKDHESVHEYEDIVGVAKNVFFVTHTHHEDHVADGRSKANQHEATFVVALCHYLLLQGYPPENITILTAYTGQLFAIKNIVKQKLLRGVRVTAVDNFQGEENDIIILSLVRSNEEGHVGFLNVENRICVALSRAKKGLFCIGNFELLQSKSSIWASIINYLKKNKMFGTHIPLQCKHHPERGIKAAIASDFDKAPEGGCGQPCEYRLPCGHVCTRPCHPDDEDHTRFKCKKPCPELCDQGHRCKKKCSDKCGPCTTIVQKTMPKCLHTQNMECGKDPSTYVCQTPCTKLLACGHKCTGNCGSPCIATCLRKVKVTFPCGHDGEVPCYASDNPDTSLCKVSCGEVLDCGHICKGTCSSCFQGRLHEKCREKCTRRLVCGHQCREPCAMNCPPCKLKCQTQCEHSKCKNRCHEPCVPCKEKCQWKCKHHQCTMLCSEPCDRPSCNKPCEKTLKKCGHRCIGLCGEPCPHLCRVCDKKEVEEIFFGDEDELDARFVELEDCKHIFTYQGLDQWMNTDNCDENAQTDVKLKECPRCKTPIRRSRRYGQIVHRQLQLIGEVKEKLVGKRLEINQAASALFTDMRKDSIFRRHFPSVYTKLDTIEPSSLTELNVLEIRYKSLKRIAAMLENLHKSRVQASTRKDFDCDATKLRIWLMQRRANFSDQEVNDLECELQRLKQAAFLAQTEHQSKTMYFHTSRAEPYLKKLRRLLFEDFAPYRENKKEKAEKYAKHLKSIIPISGLGITGDEKDMIMKAMSLTKGHWYKCKNGHVYCITECGGATEESVCPECKERIGGTGHTLRADNQVATEMDGATRPAFDPLNMHIPAEAFIWD